MKCYHCGEQLGRENICRNCGTNVKIYKKIIMSSNAYYNDALKKASVRDLSGAIVSLQTSLRFYKKNIDARNLLGLIYYEMGETVEALTEWVISKNYKSKENAANRYLDEIQKNRAKLETVNQTIKKYNQALLYCRQDSSDLAIIQLKKVLSLNPNLVRGHQLLALLYIHEGQYDLAKKSLRNAGKIDANNTLTLRYLKEANAGLKEQSASKKPKNDELISYQSGNETIIQPTHFKEHSPIGTMINMAIGIAIGVAATYFLIVPGVRTTIMNDSKKEVLEANNTISSKNQTITSLESQVDELTGQVDEAKESEENAKNRLLTYDQLLAAYQAYAMNDITTAGNMLSNVNSDDLSENSKQVYETLNVQVNTEYIAALYAQGYSAYSKRKFPDAIEALLKVVAMDESYENGNALYYLAQAYRRNDDIESAKPYYQKVVELYPGTERAANSADFLAKNQ